MLECSRQIAFWKPITINPARKSVSKFVFSWLNWKFTRTTPGNSRKHTQSVKHRPSSKEKPFVFAFLSFWQDRRKVANPERSFTCYVLTIENHIEAIPYRCPFHVNVASLSKSFFSKSEKMLNHYFSKVWKTKTERFAAFSRRFSNLLHIRTPENCTQSNLYSLKTWVCCFQIILEEENIAASHQISAQSSILEQKRNSNNAGNTLLTICFHLLSKNITHYWNMLSYTFGDSLYEKTVFEIFDNCENNCWPKFSEIMKILEFRSLGTTEPTRPTPTRLHKRLRLGRRTRRFQNFSNVGIRDSGKLRKVEFTFLKNMEFQLCPIFPQETGKVLERTERSGIDARWFFKFEPTPLFGNTLKIYSPKFIETHNVLDEKNDKVHNFENWA